MRASRHSSRNAPPPPTAPTTTSNAEANKNHDKNDEPNHHTDGPKSANAPTKHAQAVEDNADDDKGPTDIETIKKEMDNILNRDDHPALMHELEKQAAERDAALARADRLCNAQLANVAALYEFDQKQVEDEHVAQLELFKAKLLDALLRRKDKLSKRSGLRGTKRPLRRCGDGAAAVLPKAATAAPAADGVASSLPAKRGRAAAKAAAAEAAAAAAEAAGGLRYSLRASECETDLEAMLRDVDHYATRAAAAASDDVRQGSAASVYYDRNRQQLHVHGTWHDRGDPVAVYLAGQRIDEDWCISAMNAVEITCRAADQSRLKITISQLRNGRYMIKAP